jgi:predicted PurR-regulated permease PerM
MPLVAETIRNWSAGLITAALLVAALVYGQPVLLPLALACVFCFVLAPVVRWLTSFGIGKSIAVGVTVTVVSLLLLSGVFGLGSQLLSLTASLPEYRTNVANKIRGVLGESTSSNILVRAADAVTSYQKLLLNEWTQSSGKTNPSAPLVDNQPPREVVLKDSNSGLDAVEVIAGPATQAGLTFLFTLFLLSQYKDIRDRFVRVFGTAHMSETSAAISDAGDRLSNLFLAETALNAGFGAFVGFALFLIGVPNAILWGAVTFIMRFVPYIGAYVSALPPIVLSLAVDPGWGMPIATIALFAIGEPVMGQLVEPYFLGKRVGLSPFAMIISASFWALVWGPIGLVLAAPLTMIVLVIGRHIPSLEFLAVLLGDEPPLSPEQEFYHRLLSGDVVLALDALETAKEEVGSLPMVDSIVLPALRLAAIDQRREQLDPEAIKQLEETLTDVLEDLWPPERGSAEEDSEETAAVMLFAARGTIDVLATRFICHALNDAERGFAQMPSAASGLTALADFKNEHGKEATRATAIVTAGAADSKQLSYIAKRAEAKFAGHQLIILDACRPASANFATAADQGRLPVSRAADLLSLPLQPKDREAADEENSVEPQTAAALNS